MPIVEYEEFSGEKKCIHPEHNPPSMINLKPGKYVWQCPSCGHRQTFVVPKSTMLNDN